MANADVGITVTWQGQTALTGVDRLERKFDELIRTIQHVQYAQTAALTEVIRDTDRVGDAVDRTRKKFSLLRSTMAAIGVVAGLTFVANILKNVAEYAINAAGEFDVLYRQLILIEGSAGAADAKLLGLSRTLLEIGALPTEGVQLYARLATIGVQRSEELAIAVSGLSATFGLSTDAIQRTNMAITQMFSKGTFVRAEEFNQQLQESMPMAAAVAALGFQRLGNTALDTAQEIQRALQDGKLRVDDFYKSLIEGEKAFRNEAAAALNVRTQWNQLIDVIKLAVGWQGRMNGVSMAFAIVMGTVTKMILNWVESWEKLSVPDQAKQVRAMAVQIVGLVKGIETFGRVAVTVFLAVGDAIGAVTGPFDALGRGLAMVGGFAWDTVTKDMDTAAANWELRARGLRETANRFWGDLGMQDTFRNAQENARTGGTPFSDALMASLPSTEEIEEMIREAETRSAEIAELRARMERELANMPTNDPESERLAKQFERKMDRLGEMLENLEGMQLRLANLDRTASETPMEKAINDALQPFDELSLRLRDLRSDIEKLDLASPLVAEALAQVDATIVRLGESSQQAADKAANLYRISQQIAGLRVTAEVQDVENQIRDIVETVTVRFESEGQERVREAEDKLRRQREDNANTIAELELRLQEARLNNNADLALQIQLQIDAQLALRDALSGVTGAAVVAAENMRKMINAIRSSTESAVSDLIVGLVEEGASFDFKGWARNLISNITRAIADNWAKGITDSIFSFLGLGKTQDVQTINAQTLNVNGMAGGMGGGMGGGGNIFGQIAGGLGNLLGGAFGGFGDLLGGFFGSIPWFGDGGVVGGPTLFGAGEKGKEGVLPLERIGGKLGVNASMGNNVQANITIQAIDTQTGAMFLQRNADQIVGLLQQQMNLGNYR